ncbi:hypothetical protein [Fusobacterium sp. PH5-44]|uniref:hypothetical protein n=1 Tax=unclassified Fusobacterium TaxID=2648384 RepID=UPI003D1A0F5C
MKLKFSLLLVNLALMQVSVFGTDNIKNIDIPVKKVTIYSSGVGYFEHRGMVDGSSKISLPFEKKVLNDVLKSISIHDSNTSSPTINYSSEETLKRTLSSLSIDLGSNPSMVEILNSLRGYEIKIFVPEEIVGKIIGAQTENIKVNGEVVKESTLSILTNGNIKVIKTNEIKEYSFVDPKITTDMNKALNLILNFKNENIKKIYVNLTKGQKREVELNYVIATPVWKATYRFDLGQEKPYLQGWAIVDNVGEMDWDNVELSLVTGRPVSFIQNLYAPYHTRRPILPLSIAGYAQAKVYESGSEFQFNGVYQFGKDSIDNDFIKNIDLKIVPDVGYNWKGKGQDIGISYERSTSTPETVVRSAGDLFVFTAPKLITVERQQSIMIPLVQTNFEATKVSVFDGKNMEQNVITNPALGVKFKNNSGMKLPAGPITVYDADIYVGDALLEFLPENETRMISYGDDLSLTGIISNVVKENIDYVTINNGELIIMNKVIYEKTYNLKNNSAEKKDIMIEHPINKNAKLLEPINYAEKTGSIYRFEIVIGENEERKFIVKEEMIREEKKVISNFDNKTFISYSTNKEIPMKIQDALKKASEYQSEINKMDATINQNKDMRVLKLEEQDRIRKNINTIKSNSVQGKEYIKKLIVLDDEIEEIDKKVIDGKKKLEQLRIEYNNYIQSLNLNEK